MIHPEGGRRIDPQTGRPTAGEPGRPSGAARQLQRLVGRRASPAQSIGIDLAADDREPNESVLRRQKAWRSGGKPPGQVANSITRSTKIIAFGFLRVFHRELLIRGIGDESVAPHANQFAPPARRNGSLEPTETLVWCEGALFAPEALGLLLLLQTVWIEIWGTYGGHKVTEL